MKFSDRLPNQQRINIRDFRLERLNKQLICFILIGRDGRVKLLLVIIEIACAIEIKIIAKRKNFICLLGNWLLVDLALQNCLIWNRKITLLYIKIYIIRSNFKSYRSKRIQI